jgi:hypothetical protein
MCSGDDTEGKTVSKVPGEQSVSIIGLQYQQTKKKKQGGRKKVQRAQNNERRGRREWDEHSRIVDGSSISQNKTTITAGERKQPTTSKKHKTIRDV